MKRYKRQGFAMPEHEPSAKAVRKARRVDLEYAGINGIARAYQEPQDFARERETAKRVRRWLVRLDALLGDLDALLDLPGNEVLKVELSKRAKGGESLPFEAGRHLVSGNMFKGVCPTCEGAGCGDCLGRGWVTTQGMGLIQALMDRGYR